MMNGKHNVAMGESGAIRTPVSVSRSAVVMARGRDTDTAFLRVEQSALCRIEYHNNDVISACG